MCSSVSLDLWQGKALSFAFSAGGWKNLRKKYYTLDKALKPTCNGIPGLFACSKVDLQLQVKSWAGPFWQGQRWKILEKLKVKVVNATFPGGQGNRPARLHICGLGWEVTNHAGHRLELTQENCSSLYQLLTTHRLYPLLTFKIKLMKLMCLTGKLVEHFWIILETSLKYQLQRTNLFIHYKLC